MEVNNFNIGRYWPVRGPQQTLYVPSAILKPGANYVTVTELERTPCAASQHCQIEFVDVPDLVGDLKSDYSSLPFYGKHLSRTEFWH